METLRVHLSRFKRIGVFSKQNSKPGIGVAQLVGQLLQLVCVEVIVVPEHVVVAVAGHAGALDAPVTEQVEVTLGTMVTVTLV